MADRILFEACADSPEAAIAAQSGGADRVELCTSLLEGCLTPSAGSIRLARRHLEIGLQVMIRPRGGDFCYSDIEFEIMKLDVRVAREAGADGIVIGILEPDGAVDKERTQELMDLAHPLSITFHRAFDMSRDPYEALDDLIDLGVDRILTSGQENTALEGLDLIADLVQRAGDRIIIMPGAGIHERNIAKIVQQSGAREVHIAGLTTVESQMRYRNERCFMSGELRPPQFALTVTDPSRIRAMVQAGR